ncbi:MAG: NUDIX domain-containing protein [Candidatus Limnocylindrales bacterium]
MAIVALDADGRVALVRQWRLPADAALLEIPAGGLDIHEDGSKEDPDTAARRELEEETGLRADTWRKLGEFYSAPGFTDELMHLFLATDLSPAGPDGRLGPDEDERLILQWRPWRDAVAASETGEICDAKSLVGLFWLARVLDAPGAVTSTAAAIAGDPDEAGTTVGEVARARYRMTTREIVGANTAAMRRSIGTRLLGLIISALGLFAVLTVGDLLSVWMVVLGILFVTGWFAAPIAWYQARKRPDLVMAEVTLTADDRGIHFGSPLQNGLTAWETFRRVHESSGFFFLDTTSGLNMVVPRRVFSALDLATFYRLLERHGLLPGAPAKRPTPTRGSPYGSDRPEDRG